MKNFKEEDYKLLKNLDKMKTVNSISGGKTSSYIAANYPADYNIFALVSTSDKNCLFPDAKLRQIVSDKIGREFIGTLEEDTIIYTMLDLEQYIGREITWLNEFDFEDVIRINKKNGDVRYLTPSIHRRTCTISMKINLIAKFIHNNINEIVETRIGFRANETRRANNMIERLNKNGVLEAKIHNGQYHKNGNKKWINIEYQIPVFPLINDNILKDTIDKYWSDKPVRFAYMNNCIGCFHRNPMLLKYMASKHPEKFDWFIAQEKLATQCFGKSATWKNEITYEQIKNYKLQLDLFDDDFNDCDSGYCGL